MDKINFIKAKRQILAAKTIAIAGHVNPDGDSIGSLLSLGLGLKKLGKKVFMVSCDGVPERLRRLPGTELISKETNISCDLAISVDCSNKEILGNNFNIFKNAKNTLAIDHHEFRRSFTRWELLNKNAPSVGELIYLLLSKLKVKIDKNIAQNLLASIIIETNSFRLPNVKSSTFEICARLLKIGINFYALVEDFFWSRSKESVILAGICLSKCKFLENTKIAWSIIRQNEFKQIGAKDEDIDHVADEMRAISNVKIVVLFREKSKEILRVSLRSKGKINVGSIAEKLNGGGHFDVAGCEIPNNQKSIQKVLNLARQLLK